MRFKERDVTFSSWEHLKGLMLQRFLGSEDGALLHRLFAVKQVGKVANYRAQFEMLAASVG